MTPWKRYRPAVWVLACLVAFLAASTGRTQEPGDPTEDASGRSEAAERLRKLSDPEKRAAEKKRRERPPFEFYRTLIAPADVVPYAKANHWSSLSAELQANHADYLGLLRTMPVRLRDMTHEMTYQREARLLREQVTSLGFQGFFPRLPRDRTELPMELVRPESIRPDGATSAFLQRLRPHQMLIPVLGVRAPKYMDWNRFQATIPAVRDLDPTSIDRLRYYRFIHSQEPEKPLPLSPHPLTWTTISHVVWDGLNPALLNLAQQQALVDWLHWGGQLIVVAGADTSFQVLQDGFLGPYLPARPSGRNATLSREDLQPFLSSFAAPARPQPEPGSDNYHPYDEPPPPSGSPRLPRPESLYITGFEPLEGASAFHLKGVESPIIGVERRVGRGRLLVLGFQPTDAALQGWPGLDSFVRTVILRRPDEAGVGSGFVMLNGPRVSWLRYASRDIEVRADPTEAPETGLIPGEIEPPTEPVAAWLDDSGLAVAARLALEDASGIKVPPRPFILKVILAYLVALVPANWLLCRYVLRRREIAWVFTPLLALGFAGLVERAAAYDLGYDLACDELDLLELQPDHPRVHVTRFGALYSTGRVGFTIAFPRDPASLALPMNMGAGRYNRGEDVARSTWQSYPEAALQGLAIQPRSLGMFRAESLGAIPGGLVLETDREGHKIVRNGTGLTLHDATIVDVARNSRYTIGELPAGAAVPLSSPGPRSRVVEEDIGYVSPTGSLGAAAWLEPAPFLEKLIGFDFQTPEDRNEWRLVAWTEDSHPGMELRPRVNRHRGLRLVLAHLEYGPSPEPAGLQVVQVAGPQPSRSDRPNGDLPR